MLSIELAVATPAFLDLTFVGLECLPAPGEERFAGELLRSPGGGAITAVAAARLGLQTALVAPLGNDLAGEYVRRELESEGVAVAGFRTKRTPETVVMPVGEERTMVTVDPGIRARAADVAALTPVAIAANLDQLDLLPNGARSYLTCGDDDARAFSRKLPARPVGARALFLNATDALVLTGADTPEAAAERLGRLGRDGRRHARRRARDRDDRRPPGRGARLRDRLRRRHHRRSRPAVRRLRLGRPARRGARRAPELGAALLAARDERPDRHRRRGHGGAAARRGRRARPRPTLAVRLTPRTMTIRPATAEDAAAIAEMFLSGAREAWGLAADELPAEMEPPPIHGGELVAEDDDGIAGFAILKDCEIDLLFTHPRAWGRGAGRALLLAAEDALRAAPCGEVSLWTEERNANARRDLPGVGLAQDQGPPRARLERHADARAAVPQAPLAALRGPGAHLRAR